MSKLTLGQQAQNLWGETNLSVSEIARLTGLSETTVRRRGGSEPRGATLKKAPPPTSRVHKDFGIALKAFRMLDNREPQRCPCFAPEKIDAIENGSYDLKLSELSDLLASLGGLISISIGEDSC